MTSSVDSLQFQSRINDLHQLAKKAEKYGLGLGASQIEVTMRNGNVRSIEIKNNSITGVQQQASSGVEVRAFQGKKVGIAKGTSLTPDSIEEIVNSAFDLAKLVPEDPDFFSLPEPSTKTEKVDDLFDTEIANTDPENLVYEALEIVNGSTETHEKAVTGGQIRVATTERVVHNSLGITSEIKSTSFVAYSMVSIPIEPTNVGIGFEVKMSRMMDNDFDFRQLGQLGAEKAEKLLGAKVAPSKKLPVLFSERATRQSLGSIIGSGVNGYRVLTNTSYFADKIGGQVGVDFLNVKDNPHQPNGSGSSVYDDEGVSTQKINLIEKGTLLSYVTDSYTSQRLGVANTGSARKNRFSPVPRPSLSQIQIQGGSGPDLETMLSELKEGIYVESGVSPAGGSPNISSQVNRGFYVENGEIQYPLKNTMLGGEVFAFLGGIVNLSTDTLKEFGYESPAMLIDEMSVAGAGKQKQQAKSSLGF